MDSFTEEFDYFRNCFEKKDVVKYYVTVLYTLN